MVVVSLLVSTRAVETGFRNLLVSNIVRKISEKVSPIPISMQHMKGITDTCISAR